jgi:SAM-dependent methyltransferase
VPTGVRRAGEPPPSRPPRGSGGCYAVLMKERDMAVQSYPETRFGGFTRCDGTVAFYSRVHALLPPDAVVVDVGCGRGSYAFAAEGVQASMRRLQGGCARVIGLDVDPAAASNPWIDEFRLMSAKDGFPLDAGEVDFILVDNVIEHVEDPTGFLGECRRVVRCGGVIAIRTLNVASYVGLASRAVPNRLHGRVLGTVQRNRDPRDVFPTLYRCNTTRRLREVLTTSGFDPVVYAHDPEPAYLAFSRFTYLVGVLHQRYAPRAFGVNLFGFGRAR